LSRILIVEDEGRIAFFLEKGLRANGFSTSVAAGGRDALALARAEEFDLVVLDLGLPDLDGTEVLRQLREQGSQMPIIVLTARTGVTDTVEALEGGADDYVPKPFRFDELLARVRVRLRDERAAEEILLRVGDAALDLRTRRMHVGGRGVELTDREFAMAEAFFRHPGQVLSREQLLSHVWSYDHDPRSNLVDVYVGYLRRKIGDERIATVRGMGYRLVEVAAPVATGRRVLLIDDDPRIADVVVRGLAGQGWEVTVAEDGDVGLYRALTEELDAVLLDLEVSGVSGMSVLQRLSAERPEVPVVVLTARDDQRARRASRAAGAAAFVAKPFEVEGLAETLARVVAGGLGPEDTDPR
jgi:DNA-binding response OmpR family regulator